MYDLTLYRDDVPFAACEVTAAADAESIELWNLINGSDERWFEQDLLGGLVTWLDGWIREDAQMHPGTPLPDTAPNLPDGVNNVWPMSTWSVGD